MTWDEVKELAPLYVIGGLDRETALDLEASLYRATLEQQRVIADWRNVVTLLPMALPPQTPPDYIKELLFERIAEEAQQTPLEIAVEDSLSQKMSGSQQISDSQQSDSQEISGQTESNVLPFPTRRQSESRISSLMLIAATALVAFGAGYFFKYSSDLVHERDALAHERDDLSKELMVSKRQVDDIVSASTKVIAMVGDKTPQANAKVFWDTRAQQWTVYVFDLPAPPSDKDYQLWYVTKRKKISAAVFRTDSMGRTVLKLTLPQDAQSEMVATAITLENKGGSPQPTSGFYLKANLI